MFTMLCCVGLERARAASAITVARCSAVRSAAWIVGITFGITKFEFTWLEKMFQLGLS